MVRKLLLTPLLAAGMLFAAVLPAAPAAAATGGDLSGRWAAEDQADGSAQSLVFAGGGFSLLIVYADEQETEFCDGGEVLMAGRGSFLRDTVRGTVSGVCEDGTRTDPVTVTLWYDAKRDVLVDADGTVWSNIFR